MRIFSTGGGESFPNGRASLCVYSLYIGWMGLFHCRGTVAVVLDTIAYFVFAQAVHAR